MPIKTSVPASTKMY